MPSFLLQQGGGKLLLQGSLDALLLEEGDGALVTVGPRVTLTWREWHHIVTYREGRGVIGRLQFTQHAEDPGAGVFWLDQPGNLIDFSSGYTWSAKITDGVSTLLTKTAGIVGAAGSGTNPTGTPNVTITWASGELAVTPGDYTLELTPTSASRQRDSLRVPIRIIASAP